MHDLADAASIQVVRKEAVRRVREGLSIADYDFRSLYHRAYEEAMNAYARAKIVETSRTKETDA